MDSSIDWLADLLTDERNYLIGIETILPIMFARVIMKSSKLYGH